MLRQLKFTDSEAQRVYFWADTHKGHAQKFVYEARGFVSIQNHDDHIINAINKRVRPQDILFLNGDLCLNTTEEQFEEFISKINCQNVWCCFGNHPNLVKKVYFREVEKKYGEKDIEVYPFRYKNLIFWGEILECIINKQGIIISHFPLKVWDGSKYGFWNLSGHSHYSDKERRADYKFGRSLDIGVDGKIDGPYSFYEIAEIMKSKEIVHVDAHH